MFHQDIIFVDTLFGLLIQFLDKDEHQGRCNKIPKQIKTEEEWRKILSPAEFHILREKGTEPPFTGKLLKNTKNGVYVCAACGNELFSSETKFDSGTGWPSFWHASSNDSIELKTDNSHGLQRTEVICKKCGGHLGHLFNDGPQPSGQRYCMNSISLNFKENKKY